jgi:CelD/BcsL family acetyltransferase involved in cellulose biosynthesis
MAGTELVIRETSSPEAFDQLQRPWNALVDQLKVPSPFQSWEWNRIWWRHFGRGRRLRILGFFDDSELVGIAPFHQRHYGLGPLSASLLVPIGWEDVRRGSQLTEQWELLFPPLRRRQLFTELSRWLMRTGWTAAILPGLTDEDLLPDWISARVIRQRAYELPHRRLPSNFEEFVKGLNKSMRDNVRYYPRLLARHGHRASFEVAREPVDVDASLGVLFDLHRARARAAMRVEHGDKFQTPRRRAFMREVAAALAPSGQIRLGILRLGGEPVAAQLWLERDRTIFLLHSGYQPAWAPYSVAMVATLETLKDGMARGVEQVEFLRGIGQFKDRWDLSRRTLTQVLTVRQPAIWRALLALREMRPSGPIAFPGF